MSPPNAPSAATGADERAARLPGPLMSDPEYRTLLPIILRLASWRLADQAHPQVRHWGVPVLCAVLGIPAVLNSSDGVGPWTDLALALAYATPLLWRDRRPLLVFALIIAVAMAALPLGALTGAGAAWIVAVYNVGRRCPPRQVAGAVAVTVAFPLTWASWALTSDQLRHLTRVDVVTLMAIVTLAACAGLGLAGRLVDAALTALEKERDQQARLAAAQERARVSREMHDILGHTLAVIVGLADGAAALSETRPERGADTLRIIADSGRDALGELRRLLAVIGKEDTPQGEAPLAPQPGLADLDALLERFRAAGPTATLHTEGDLTALTQGLQLAAYRIAQEALTNTLKYAGTATTVTVSLTAGHGLVRLTVADTGPAQASHVGRPRDGSGRGLVGMRQRAALYQGSITAGHNNDGGWTVRALLKTTPPTGTTAHPTEEPPA
ncbi:sensor histidine kinase [Streptomyces olindensis]|uniref:sensor histidine kinase n=1 Tax=Streptomyces olindensis TaxID=358823 RepID=UPI00368B61C1